MSERSEVYEFLIRKTGLDPALVRAIGVSLRSGEGVGILRCGERLDVPGHGLVHFVEDKSGLPVVTLPEGVEHTGTRSVPVVDPQLPDAPVSAEEYWDRAAMLADEVAAFNGRFHLAGGRENGWLPIVEQVVVTIVEVLGPRDVVTVMLQLTFGMLGVWVRANCENPHVTKFVKRSGALGRSSCLAAMHGVRGARQARVGPRRRPMGIHAVRPSPGAAGPTRAGTRLSVPVWEAVMIAKDSSLIPAAAQAADPIKIGLMSDLHLEFEPAYRNRVLEKIRGGDSSEAAKAFAAMRARENEPGHPENGPDLRALKRATVDFVLMPGDIDIAGRGVRYADAVAQYLGCPVHLCLGNHDAYGADLDLLIAKGHGVAKETHGRVVVLESERTDLLVKGRQVAIFGGTLWTDYDLAGDPAFAMDRAGRALNDHTRIRLGEDWLSPGDALEIHIATKAWLEKELLGRRSGTDLRIVMSHHGPIPDAIPPKYRGHDLSAAFATDLRSEIEAWKPDLWVWGHTHHSIETQVGATRMVSAQRGYVGVEPDAESFLPVIVEI